MPRSDWIPDESTVDIDCTIVRETERAYCIDYGTMDSDHPECWVPKRLCQWNSTEQTMTMPTWLAYDRGLI